MRLKAEVITAEEAVWCPKDGKFVVVMSQFEKGERTGQQWGIFQGSKKKCDELSEEINRGFNHFKIEAKKGL